MNQSVGILGVAAYLPTEIRTNDYWPESVARAWRERALQKHESTRKHLQADGSRAALASLKAITEIGPDPFHGSKERRAMPPGMKVWDMETIAAREAIDRAGVKKEEIDLVLGYQMIPDYINVPSSMVVHHNLGLNERCTTMQIDAVCNSFMMQLTMAQAMIQSGQARYALLTQGCGLATNLPPSGEQVDLGSGDGATAVVVGPVSDRRGILSYSHHTLGAKWGALVCGVPGKHWAQDRCIAYSEDRAAGFDMISSIVHRAEMVVTEALADAKVAPEDVNFYACHQPFKWFRPASLDAIGLKNAKSIDHFPFTASLSAANLPFQLAMGEKEGLLRPGDLAAFFQGGTGSTVSGMTLRWGR
jgi:3-oxoacyl-[acyl-carrier-protein] synthase-3